MVPTPRAFRIVQHRAIESAGDMVFGKFGL
jgi:hypothetical protein